VGYLVGNSLLEVTSMDTSTVKRRARRGAEEVRKRAGDLGEEARDRAGQVGQAVRTRAGDLGQRAAVRTRGARRTVGYWIAGERPPKRSRWWVVGAGAAGAAAAFFLDPVSGKRRRHVAGSWVAGRFRSVGTRVRRTGRAAGAETYGVWRSATHVREAGLPENDATLAHKVESEVFQGLDVPSGRVNVNAESGVVYLRGTVDRPDQIDELERRTRRVNGVLDVRNMVHLAATPAT
jgi:BON domain